MCRPPRNAPFFSATGQSVEKTERRCAKCDRLLWEHWPWVMGLDGKSLPDDPCFGFISPTMGRGIQIRSADPMQWEFT